MPAALQPLLSLTPERIAREVRAAEAAAYWAAEARYASYRPMWFGARLWFGGVWLIGWSARTSNYDVGQIEFWLGVLLGYLGMCCVVWAVWRRLEEGA